MVKEQRTKEEMIIVTERRKAEDRRKSSNINYLLLNLEIPDRRRGKDRRGK